MEKCLWKYQKTKHHTLLNDVRKEKRLEAHTPKWWDASVRKAEFRHVPLLFSKVPKMHCFISDIDYVEFHSSLCSQDTDS